ncbi:MAG: DUF305 domain-containing protein [Hyphomicrobiales bacterium]|nr:DUF305 domain-containing protein [Hyphomicrobiales bacterium]
MNRTTLTVLSLGLIFSTSAIAQSDTMKPAAGLPAACTSAPMGKMTMSQKPPMMMMDDMNETQKAFHTAMMKMEPAMMQGMMIADPDIAWACSMIPHHQSAIDMSKALLKTGNNAEMKSLAEKIITDQEKEIAQLTEWVGKQAKRAGK